MNKSYKKWIWGGLGWALIGPIGAILGFAARAGGGVEVGSVSSAGEPESPLQATARIRASPPTVPMNIFCVNFNRLLNWFLVMLSCCQAN